MLVYELVLALALRKVLGRIDEENIVGLLAASSCAELALNSVYRAFALVTSDANHDGPKIHRTTATPAMEIELQRWQGQAR